MSVAIKFEDISKQYRLGLVSTRTIQHDLNRWWQVSVCGKEDPYLKIGEVNDRSTKGISEYVWALRDISFDVEQGDVLGIIGKNGAGKSTLLKILSKVTAPTTGIIKAKGRIASLLEVGTGFHPELTGRENIYMNGAILGMTKVEITRKLDEIVDFSGVERYLDTPTKRYSSGMTVRLGFAIAAHLDPEILVVDEVLAVGDAEFQKKAIGKMQDVSKGEGRTVLFVSHNMVSVKSLCTKGVVLDNGYVSFSGTVEDAIEKYVGDINEENLLISECIVSDNYRRWNTSREIEIVKATLLNTSTYFSLNEDIEVLLELRKNQKEINSFSIEMMITDMSGVRVGSYISEIFSLEKQKDDFFIKIKLSNHNLAKGIYRLSFNIGLKDIVSGLEGVAIGLKDYDVVYDVLSFEVIYADIEKKKPIILWRQGWGNCNFINGEVQLLNL